MIKLKDDAVKFANPDEVKAIIKKYSNFVSHPIYLNGERDKTKLIYKNSYSFFSHFPFFFPNAGERVNTMKPLWKLPANQVTDDEHTEFYRFISNAWDKPLYRMQYRAEAPLQVQALLYIPEVKNNILHFLKKLD